MAGVVSGFAWTPVGGTKEKILAAKCANIKELILCEDNRKDIEEINEKQRKGLTFYYVKQMDEVIELESERT